MLKNRKVRIILILSVCFCFTNCLSFRTGGSETSPIQTITTIRTLQNQYASKHQGRFAQNFDELIKSGNLDEQFAGEKPIIIGYIFEMTVNEPTENKPAFFSIKANPQISEEEKSTETRSYYFDSTLDAIKYSENGEANAQSPSI